MKGANLTLTMPRQVLDKLDAEKKRTGYGASEIVRRALDDYFEKRDQVARFGTSGGQQ